MAEKNGVTRKVIHLNIMQAAKELFLEKRYSAITVDEIAKRAGVTKRTVYGHFPSKLALFVHMFDDYLQQLQLELLRVLKIETEPLVLLRNLADALFHFTRENERFMRLFWTLGSDEFEGVIPEELIERIKLWNRSMIFEVTRVVKKNGGERLFERYDPELLYHLMSAINKGIFLHTNKSDKFRIATIDPEHLYQLMMGIVERGIFGMSRDVEATEDAVRVRGRASLNAR